MPQTIEATTDISSTATQSGAEGGDAMVPEVDWTRIAVTFIKSFFGFLSRRSRKRRDNGDSAS